MREQCIIKKPNKTHKDWLQQEFKDEVTVETTANTAERSNFEKKLKKLINSNTSGSISIDAGYLSGPTINISQNELCLDRAINLSIINIDKDVIIEGLAIRRLTLRGADGKRPFITIKNSLIKRLTVNVFSSNSRLRIKIDNSGVFTLRVEKNSIFNLTISGGYIWNIQCPAPYEDNPISGAVTIGKDVLFGTEKIDGAFAEAQGYRNMRHHMLQLNNSLAANRFHAAELVVLRKTEDGWFTKFVSKSYELSSDYGNSIGRPIALLFGLAAIFTAATFQFDDPVLVGTTEGWKTILDTPTLFGRLAKASVNTLQSTLNPLGILGYKSIVIPNNGWFVFFSMIYNLISIVLITLTILAIRRRFRIQSSN